MNLITQNVKAFLPMPQFKVRHDVRLTGVQAGDRGVILWQECERPRYQRAIRDLGPLWDHHMPEGIGVPISWRADAWECLDRGLARLHAGKATVCKPRQITYVILRNRHTGRVVVFTNRHYVPGAHSPRPVTFRTWRQKAWAVGNSNDHALLVSFLERGYTVVGGGDYNRTKVFSPPHGTSVKVPGCPTAVPVVSFPQGKDWLFLMNADATTRVAHGPAETLPDRYSDHRGLRVRFRFTRRDGGSLS